MTKDLFRNYLLPTGTYFLVILVFLLVYGCTNQDAGSPRFKSMDQDRTSVDFVNRVTPSPDFNFLNYLYFYDGGGISVGDINNDGLPDLYFTGNMESNKLFLNKGNFEFTEITEQAGVAGMGEWTTGTTMADVNGDGLLDIYVCNVDYLSMEGRNQLFINNGDSTFSEKAKEYGIGFSGYSKQAAFFDMDNDGDLDMYLVNHAVHTENSFQRAEKRKISDPKAGDRLYENKEGEFVDVTEKAGIYSSILGYGLAVTVSDLNGDNYQDIYVSNDFHENDYLYINQQDGTFKESLEEATQHTSRASMGSDIGDINNDLKPDIAVLDMLPQDEERRKTSISYEPHEVYSIQREYGYHPQLIRNTMQLNLGEKPNGNTVFAEIAPLSGTAATDWSWSVLLFDMDNSGSKDLFVSNGIYRRPNDLDYLSLAGGKRMQRSLDKGINEQNLSLSDSMPHVKIPNAAFKNNTDLTFSEKTSKWGLATPSYSSGSAYGDLDNDGDLDLIVNNVNMPASVYKNRTTERDSADYLTISLKGNAKNTMALGSKVIATVDGQSQLSELVTTRGFQSSVEPRVFFGFGEVDIVDSVQIVWPDGTQSLHEDIQPNQHLTFQQPNADQNPKDSEKEGTILKPNENLLDVPFKHSEDGFNGFKKQPLMPYQLSNEGPALAVADVNGDGMDDFYIGGAQWQSGSLYLQEQDGTFKKQSVAGFKQDRVFEDTDAVFFDANNDGAPDLYIVSGGNEHPINSSKLFDRFYLNNGEGQFSRETQSFPAFGANGSVAVPIDYNNDGYLDLFVGSRSIPENYGVTPQSYLFKNQGDGSFVPVTETAAPGLKHLGMISDAIRADVNGDDQTDLIVAGDWMPVTVFINQDGTLQEKEIIDSGHGLWQSLHAADMDNDGDVDILAGNMGLNTTLDASDDAPMMLFSGDFNGNGKAEAVIGKTREDGIYPIVGRDMLLEQMPYLRPKFPDYDSFAGKTLSEIFEATQLESARKKRVDQLGSVYFENTNGGFTGKKLPQKAQFAPIYAFQTGDFDSDGVKDILAGGNQSQVLPVYGGPYDASYGWFMRGMKNGRFSVWNPGKSGFFIDGEIRAITPIKSKNDTQILLGVNGQTPVFFEY